MNKVPLIALSVLAASALPAAHADAKPLPKTAYFKVFATATQDIAWKRDETVKSCAVVRLQGNGRDRKSTRLNSSHLVISYAVFCLKKKNNHVLYPTEAHHITIRIVTVVSKTPLAMSLT